MSELMDQHSRWSEARGRLLNGGPIIKPAVERRVSEALQRAAIRSRIHRLFPEVIVEVDEYGNDALGPVFKPRWRKIAEEVAAKHKISMTDLRSARRSRELVAARHEAFWRCKNETTLSLPQIGRLFGHRDHTTILHGIRKHIERLAEAQ